MVAREGSPDVVLDYYNALVAKREHDAQIEQERSEAGRTVTRSGNHRAEIVGVEMSDEEGRQRTTFVAGETALLRCSIRFDTRVERPTVGFVFRDRLGNEVFGTNTYHLNVFEPELQPGEWLETTFRVCLSMGHGTYSVSVAVHTDATHVEENFDWWDQALVFQVVPGNQYRFVGSALLPVEATLRKRPALTSDTESLQG
jgi:lipopolysaccharide transport system ATP-binding protein